LQQTLNEKNSFEFERVQEKVKEIKDKKLLEKLFKKHLPKKRSKFISLVSEKYGYDITKKLDKDIDEIFYEFYGKKI
jgi:hypothetical protein